MDHYLLLGVHSHANEEEIKKAFRKLAVKYHPDKHTDSSKYVKAAAEGKFKQVSEAYETLIDDAKRRNYNRIRDSGHQSRKRYEYNHEYEYSRRGATAGAGMGKNANTNFRSFSSRLRNLSGLLIGGCYLTLVGGILWASNKNHMLHPPISRNEEKI